MLEVGEYSIDYSLGSQVKTMNVKVRDTIAPQLELKRDITIFENQKVDYIDCLNIDERSYYKVTILDGNVDYSKAGLYQAKVNVKDEYGNENSVDVPVKVEELKLILNQNKVNLTKNGTFKLEVETNSLNSIEYKSNDEDVAIVDENGKIKAIADGKTTISVTVDGKTVECNVIVKTPVVNKAPSSNAGGTSKPHNSHNSNNSYNSDTIGATVYITNTGSKYHRDGCRYLRSSQIAISESNALSQGFDPCKVCRP